MEEVATLGGKMLGQVNCANCKTVQVSIYEFTSEVVQLCNAICKRRGWEALTRHDVVLCDDCYDEWNARRSYGVEQAYKALNSLWQEFMADWKRAGTDARVEIEETFAKRITRDAEYMARMVRWTNSQRDKERDKPVRGRSKYIERGD